MQSEVEEIRQELEDMAQVAALDEWRAQKEKRGCLFGLLGI